MTMNTCIRSWESFGSTFFACSCQRFDWICNEVSRQEWQCLDTYSGWFAALMGARCLAELSLFGWLIINNQRIIFDFQPQPRTKLYRLQYSGEFLWEGRCLERSLGVQVQAGAAGPPGHMANNLQQRRNIAPGRCQVIGEAGGRIGDGLWSCHQCM